MRYFIYCRKSTEAEDRQVASIESQLTTLQRAFGGNPDIEIAAIYEEAFSAKAPGRERFGAMLARIERGEADGIIAWAPDRLARNSIDGGRVIYMLDCGVIRDLKFATCTFENNSQGKFMLQIMFGQSKYYSDALSDNVKRGNRTKLENGWRPNQAPLGYRNDPATKTIVREEMHFPIIRQMFEMMLSGSYSPRQIAIIARDDWSFRTPKRKRTGGKPLAMSTVYKILSNPFYAGQIIWGGQTYPGKHEPIVSPTEFRAVRRLLERPGRPRPQRYTFPYTGMIRCGACGLMVTAEHKINRYGSHYIYYHCSRPRLGAKCTEPSIEVRSLETQILAFVKTLGIDIAIVNWIAEQLKIDNASMRIDEDARRKSLEAAAAEVRTQLNELTGLRVRCLLTDDEFVKQRRELQQEQLRLQEAMAASETAHDPLELFSEVTSFSNRAAEWFAVGDEEVKRLILETVGSNLSLKDGILNVEAKKPFASTANLTTSPHHLGVVDDVRTFDTRYNMMVQLAREMQQSLDTEEGRMILANIRTLRERFQPEMLKPPRAKAA